MFLSRTACFFALALAGFWLGQPAAGDEKAERKLEPLLLLPEPRELRTSWSIVPDGALKTVLTPAQEIAGLPGIATLTKVEFTQLGLSIETFSARARAAADRVLAELKPDVIKGTDGKVKYAVFRGERPIMACLLMAPSLPQRFQEMFGPEIWVALPDRHALFVFPPKPEAIEEFAADLADRYRDDPNAASAEVFAIKANEEPRVVATFVP